MNEHFFALAEKEFGGWYRFALGPVYMVGASLPSLELQNKNFSAN